MYAGRQIVVPQGSRLNGRVETVEPATRDGEARVRLVFREIEFADGRRISTWITNSFAASRPPATFVRALYGNRAAGGALIGGKAARVAGILGGTLIGFVIAANSSERNPPTSS